MTDRDEADARLKTAFQSLGETAGDDVSADDLDRVWRAVAGELPETERQELVDRMASEPGLAEAWRAARELMPQAAEPTASSSRPWSRSWMAAAALVVVTVAAGLLYQLSRPPAGDKFRASQGVVVESLVGADAALPRDAFRLRWTPGPAGSRYQVRVTTEDLRVLTVASDLPAAELVVQPEALAGVPAGARVLWQVDVSLPSGATLSSETFVVRLQ